MKVLKLDKDAIAALKKLGFEVAEDNESVQGSCCVSMIHPDGNPKFLVEIATPNGGYLTCGFARDLIIAAALEPEDAE